VDSEPQHPWHEPAGKSTEKTAEESPRSVPYISPKMVAALSVPARVRIIAELKERPMSPTRYAEEWNLDVPKTCRHFNRLEKLGYLEVVDEVSGGRRGAPERIFRATQIVVFDTAMWELLPEPIRRDYSGVIWETYGKRVNQALEAGTLDADVDRHFSWKPLKLDRRAWTQFIKGLDDFLDWVMDLEVESDKRMQVTGEEPINSTVGLAGFRSPKTAQDGPPVR
jgi:hypothetical protein